MPLSHEERKKIAEALAKREEELTGLEKELSVPVRKSNDIIQKERYSLSLREQRLLLYCISKIKPDDEGNKRYKIKIRDAAKICGVNETNIGGRTYNIVFEAFSKLRDNGFNIYTQKGRGRIAFIDNPFQDGEGNIEFNFNSYVVPYLFQIKKRFTQYDLGIAVRLRSSYGIRLYELMKSYQNLGSKKFTLEELRQRLGAEEKSYSEKYGLFRKYVLEPALKDLDNTDLKVSYVELKEGRKIVGIEFIITEDRVGYFEKAGLFDDE